MINYNFDKLANLKKINIVLGKNGCGKSTLLRSLKSNCNKILFGKINYISPERGGNFNYDPNLELQLTTNPEFVDENRRNNQNGKFRQESTAKFGKLESSVLREVEQSYIGSKPGTPTFDTYIEKIKSLLENIEIKRSDRSFKIFKKNTVEEEIKSGNISSGEAELISLGIECLIFAKEVDPAKENFLLLDEPDVHLHPDLQVRLMAFLSQLTQEAKFKVIIATHSTALLGELADNSDAAVAFMKVGDTKIEFRSITKELKKVLPVFGAHPLSTVFNNVSPLIVDGEDDERIWQQAIRSSQGKLKLYPISNNGEGGIPELEKNAAAIIDSVYDNGVGFSLRDRDGGNEEIADELPIKKSRLSCRAAENLILTDEVLGKCGKNWQDLESAMREWVKESSNMKHSKYNAMINFQKENFDRKIFDIKELRLLIVDTFLGSNKPWEILVGQAIGELKSFDVSQEGSLANFLGEKTVNNLLQDLLPDSRA